MTPEPFPLIIAAAGRSRRYGRPKLLESMPGSSTTLIEHVVSQASEAGAWPVLVVVGPIGESPYDRIAALARPLGAYVLHVSPAPEEMRRSVEAGLSLLEEMISNSILATPRYVAFTPADMPGLAASFIECLSQHCRERSETLVRGLSKDGRGIHPVALAWKERGVVTEIEPEFGLNRLWDRPGLSRFEWLHDAPLARHDLDNPQDWQRFGKPGSDSL